MGAQAASVLGAGKELELRAATQYLPLALLSMVLFYATYSIILYPFYISPFRHLPMPPGRHWLWGHAPAVMKVPKSRLAEKWLRAVPNDGLIRYLWFFNKERILVTSPKAIAEVLVSKSYIFKKPDGVRHTLGRIIGYGLVLTEGKVHKMQRRNLMPAFAFRRIKNLYPVFWNKTREMVEAIAAGCGKDGKVTVEIQGWASRCTLDILGEATMGKSFGAIEDENSPIIATYRNLFEPSRQAVILGLIGSILPRWIADALPVKRNTDIFQAGATLRKLCQDIVDEKKTTASGKNSSPEVNIISAARQGGHFSESDLIDQLLTFLAAGHETTATALTWAVYMLAAGPGIQAKLRCEVRARLSSLDRVITSSDIDDMEYLNAVCNETLRYWCPLPHTPRQAAENTTIEGQPVPQGTRIVISSGATNRDPALWGPDAHIFDPERWIGETADCDSRAKRLAASGGATSNYAFLTFLHGPRSCIGEKFARAELACMLAGLVGRFDIQLRDEELLDENKIPIRNGVVARPLHGLHVVLTPLEGF
ncbi:hypothetical protein PWT90_09416 [Aphanocladium album]|nr:hypothetical protein PWT90_09416 [Aphanocladium album]